MPDKKERDLWWAFLTGRPESEWNPPRKPKQPKVSRWQQRKLQGKGARPFADDLHEDASLSYDFPENASEETLPSAGSKVEAEVSYQGHAAQSLPTPSGTPAPPETPADISIQTDDMSVNIDTPIPPEPTPMLMQHIDHVRPSNYPTGIRLLTPPCRSMPCTS